MLTLGSTKNSVLQKNCYVNKKKIFHIEVNVAHKIMWVTKKYVVATKKIRWHPKEDSFWLNV